MEQHYFFGFYFDDEKLIACVNKGNDQFVQREFDYAETVPAKIAAWLKKFPPTRTHVCISGIDSPAHMMADIVADGAYSVYLESLEDIFKWITTHAIIEPDGSPAKALVRYCQANYQELTAYQARPEAERELDGLLDLLDMLDVPDGEASLTDEKLTELADEGITPDEYIQQQFDDVHAAIREHLRSHPELMTEELMVDFFPEMIDGRPAIRH